MRPENGRLDRAAWRAVVDRVDQNRHAQRVGQEDEFLALFGARLAHGGEEADRGHPLLLGQLDLAHEVVQMPDQRGHDGLEARIVAAGEPPDHRLGQGVFVELSHDAPRTGCAAGTCTFAQRKPGRSTIAGWAAQAKWQGASGRRCARVRAQPGLGPGGAIR
jgi:hypothetical protein